MRKIRKVGTALALAAFVATGMMASSASLYAAGPGTGNGTSQSRLCDLLKSAIALVDPTSELGIYLQAQWDAYCAQPAPTVQ